MTDEATSYIAYSGPFHVDEDKKTLTHSKFASLFRSRRSGDRARRSCRR